MLRDLIDFNDLTLSEWEDLFRLGLDIYDNPKDYGDYCGDKILASVFYEPSTRTNFSFQSAMLKLGGKTIGFSGTSSTSVSKGETLADTVKVVANYSDVIVIRHPVEGAAYAASLYSPVPVINAGDGGHLHPTQTMTDLFTIGKLKNKKMTGLAIGVCGDLLYGRTVHSLLKAFALYSGNTFYFISTPSLAVPGNYIDSLKKNNNIIISETIEECIDKLDIIYMTRIQRERFDSEEEYRKQTGIYILGKEKLKRAKKDLTILHPLPKNNEISPEVDDDPRALYFEQAKLGLYIRMALLVKILENPKTTLKMPENNNININKKCANKNCVINTEENLPDLIKTESDKILCVYCESEL
ncbi:MAG: aspartate carbamoyltransferase [Oscillospiraceae bacterium]|nr:aspartate carbamoyltransferase [Oscillospiraceae bacterium]